MTKKYFKKTHLILGLGLALMMGAPQAEGEDLERSAMVNVAINLMQKAQGEKTDSLREIQEIFNNVQFRTDKEKQSIVMSQADDKSVTFPVKQWSCQLEKFLEGVEDKRPQLQYQKLKNHVEGLLHWIDKEEFLDGKNIQEIIKNLSESRNEIQELKENTQEQGLATDTPNHIVLLALLVESMNQESLFDLKKMPPRYSHLVQVGVVKDRAQEFSETYPELASSPIVSLGESDVSIAVMQATTFNMGGSNRTCHTDQSNSTYMLPGPTYFDGSSFVRAVLAELDIKLPDGFTTETLQSGQTSEVFAPVDCKYIVANASLAHVLMLNNPKGKGRTVVLVNQATQKDDAIEVESLEANRDI